MKTIITVCEPVDRALDENDCYPGEFEYNRNQMLKQNELNQFSTEELYDEINRRNFEPYLLALEEMKATLDKLNGVTPEKPF